MAFVCSVQNCAHPVRGGNGYCSPHYQRWARHGDPLAGKQIKRATPTGQVPICGVLQCETVSRARGYCNKHYARFKRYGDPLTVFGAGGPRPKPRRVCDLADCDATVVSRKLCSRHYGRLMRHGDPTVVLSRGPGDAQGYLDGHDGYRRIYVPGRGRLREHRVLMEKILGRELLPEENVHHKNGDRADNRPENIELWTRSQPPGQRVEDKVAWAIELLRLYRPDALA